MIPVSADTMLKVMFCPTCRDNILESVQCYHQEPVWCIWSNMPLESMLMSMVCAAAWDHIMKKTITATTNHVDFRDACCLWGLVWSLWFQFSPTNYLDVMDSFFSDDHVMFSLGCCWLPSLYPMVDIASRNLVGVCDLCCHWAPLWCPWSKLPSETVLMSVIHDAGTFLMSMIHAVTCNNVYVNDLCWH